MGVGVRDGGFACDSASGSSNGDRNSAETALGREGLVRKDMGEADIADRDCLGLGRLIEAESDNEGGDRGIEYLGFGVVGETMVDVVRALI
jgi:hypothetical protein